MRLALNLLSLLGAFKRMDFMLITSEKTSAPSPLAGEGLGEGKYMDSNTTGFNKLDFAEAKRIAEMVSFDVMQYAKKLRSCGPGCDYFSKDKKYFITMLLKHIGILLQKDQPEKTFTTEVMNWYQKAKAAEQDQQKLDKQFVRIRLGKS